MPNLTDIIEQAQAEARATCTQCLIDYLHEETGELTGKFATLAAAEAQRGSARDGEARYAEAFTEVVRTALAIAIYTAELSGYRSVQWSGTGQPGTVTISPN
jgi:hypothetical protein